jgi:hypothetical protein
MSRMHSALVLGLALALGLALGPSLRPAPANDIATRASWKDVFESPAALAQGVDAVVLVTAEGTEPGRTAVGDLGTSPVSFVLNHFRVDEAFKGDVTLGSMITVEQTAEVHADGSRVGIDSDGGPYTAGRQYLLYLQKQPGTDYWYVVSYQGRYNVEAGRLVGVHAHDAVVQAIQFQPSAEVASLVRNQLSSPIERAVEEPSTD